MPSFGKKTLSGFVTATSRPATSMQLIVRRVIGWMRKGSEMKLSGVLIGSEDPQRLKTYYTKLLAEPTWEDGGYFGRQVGDSGIAFRAHDHGQGTHRQPS